jgi:hypothetical protein
LRAARMKPTVARFLPRQRSMKTLVSGG